MTNLLSFFIRRPKVTNLILALVVVAGVLSAATLQRQGDPTIDFDIMKITTEYPGASPEDVEINVTDPIEDQLAEVEDVDEMKSLSMENLSIILLWVNPDSSDVERVKRDIRAAVDRVTNLPRQVTDKPKVEEMRSTNVAVLEIAISGDVPELELRKLAKDLEEDLKRAKGVGVIEKIGYRKREIEIEADLVKLEDRYVSLNEVMNAIQARNVRTTGGSLESYVTEKKIVTFSEYADPLEVKDVVIRSTFTGEGVRISDVARVEEGFEEHDIIPRADGQQCISLLVRSQAGADVITLSEDVHAIVERFQKGLPEGVTANIIFDLSTYTRSLLSMVRLNGLMGFVLVLVVMMFFLDWKSAFWTAFGIPIAICGSFIFFGPFDITFNVVSLSAMVLVLGMLVDDAIVISENVYRMKEEGMEPTAATIAGVRNVFWPVTASVLTTVLAFLPMLFMKGLIGKFVFCIPVVVTLMLIFSLIESTCFLPSHIAHVVPPKEPPKRTRWIARGAQWYKRRIAWCLKHRWRVLSIYIAVLVIIPLASMKWLKFVLFPQTDPDIFHIVVETPQGTPQGTTAEKIAEVEALVEEVVPAAIRQSYTTRVGHHDINVYGGTAGNYDNWGLVTVYLQPAEDRDVRSEEIIAAIAKRLPALEGFQRLDAVGAEEGPPVGKPVTMIFTSDDNALRKQFEEEAIAFLKTIDGVFGVESSDVPGKDELRLILDYDTMARLGITAVDVSRTVRAAFDGEVVTSIRREGEEIDFRVRLKDPKQYLAEDVLKLSISNQLGKLVPLGSFAHLEPTTGPAVLHHYAGRRSVTVTSEVDTKRITSAEVNALVREHFGPAVSKHAGFQMELGGEEKKTQESMQSFWFALILALVAIYFLLVVVFDSFLQPILIMTAIPFAVVGVFITFMAHGIPLGFIALIGVLGLVGVVVNTSIVMIDTLNEKTAQEGLTLATIVDGAALRFRPVILTTITTVAGLLPTCYGIGGDLPFIRPMVLALAWGLVFATLISLVFIPLIYTLYKRVEG